MPSASVANDFYYWQADQLYLLLHVQPRASRTEIVGVQHGRLKIKLTAPPVDGQANAEMVKLLAKQFGVSRSQVTLLSGETGRDKRVCIAHPKKLIAGIMAS